MWIAVIVIGLGTYLTRLSFIGAFGERSMPAWMEVPLRYVAPAVLGAIVLPAVVQPEGTIEFLPSVNPRFLAAVIAAASGLQVAQRLPRHRRRHGLPVAPGLAFLNLRTSAQIRKSWGSDWTIAGVVPS